MKILTSITLSAGLLAGPALAGGIEAFPTQNHFLFEEGTYAEVTAVYADPKHNGTELGQATGDVTPSVSGGSVAYKRDFGSNWVFAVRAFKSLDYRLRYPTGTTAPSAGTNVDYRGYAVDLLARYKFNQNISVFGGVRMEKLTRFDGQLVNPALNYGLTSSGDFKPGVILGAAYEIPDIRFRADLTYTSEIKHDLSGTETLSPLPGVPFSNQFISPESVALNVQSAISDNLYALGSINWRNWKSASINSPTLGGPLLQFAEDSVDVQLGLGFQMNPKWYFYGILSRSEPEGGIVGFDYDGGVNGVTIGTIYTHGKTRIIADITHGRFGDVNEPTSWLRITGAKSTALRLSVARTF